MIRVPTAAEYERLPFEERGRVLHRLRLLLIEYAETEAA